MISTSFEFRQLAQSGACPLVKATLYLADGTVEELTGDDFMEGGFSFSHATSSMGSFDLGAAIVGAFKCTLNNIERKFDEYDFGKAKIIPFVGYALEDGIEWIRKGTYHCEQPSAYDATIALECVDSMSKFEVEYAAGTVFPATASVIVQDICVQCGVPLLYARFANCDVVFQECDLSGLTCRDVLSYVAQATGNYARITNDDRLEIGWYDSSAFDAEDWLDGEEFDDGDPYQSGSVADGGNFDDYTSGDSYDGGSFDAGKIVNIFDYTSATVNTDDVVITGVRVFAEDEVVEDGGTGRDGEVYLSGEEGYVLEVSGNPLVTFGRAKYIADAIAKQVVGLHLRPFDTSALGDPRVEAGDAAMITDRYQNVHRGYLTSVTYKVGAFAAYACSAEPQLRNNYGGSSAVTKALKGVKDAVKREKTAREAAVERLQTDLANSSGMYSTKKAESDGSVTYLLHDKPTLGQSEFVWKVNAAGLGISTNGGKSYDYGIDKWGTAILNSIYAVGINADHIDAGALRVRDKKTNKTIFEANVKTGQFWWDTQHSSLDEVGRLRISGGVIGSLNVSNSAMYYGKTSLLSSEKGTYISKEGISTGSANRYIALLDGRLEAGRNGKSAGYISFSSVEHSESLTLATKGDLTLIIGGRLLWSLDGEFSNNPDDLKYAISASGNFNYVRPGDIKLKLTKLTNLRRTDGTYYPSVTVVTGVEVAERHGQILVRDGIVIGME